MIRTGGVDRPVEISASGRLEVRITAADVGKRVSVRRMTDDGDTVEKFTDTVGVLTSWDDGVLLITRRTGQRVRIAESTLVAGKVVPSAPARRRGPAASYEELARVAARAWRPVESERLGDWELRAAAWVHPARQFRAATGRPGRAAGRRADPRPGLVRRPRAPRLHPDQHGRRGHGGTALRGAGGARLVERGDRRTVDRRPRAARRPRGPRGDALPDGGRVVARPLPAQGSGRGGPAGAGQRALGVVRDSSGGGG